jgi:protease I
MKSFSGYKIAVLASNGFDEAQFLGVQKHIQEMGAHMVLVSSNQGLVNGWNGNGWGHNYAVDVPLNTALGVDYDAVVVIGGERSLEKLKQTAHTRRFISSFVSAEKPVCLMADAAYLMRDMEISEGQKVSDTEAVCLDGHIMSGACNAETLAEYMASMRELMANSQSEMKQAA